MSITDIQDWCISQDRDADYLVIPEYLFSTLDESSAQFISDFFNHKKLIRLPESEIRFFEWLKENDLKIWNDLWLDESVEPYIVSITFLPLLTDKTIGFPICDLVENDNYYFTAEHIRDEEANMFLDSIRARFLRKDEITLQQALLLRISLFPTDIWHFAYNFNMDLNAVKKAVHELINDKMLIHLTETGHLAPFVQV